MLRFECIHVNLNEFGNRLCGEVLTIVEAIVPAGKQSESAKMIVKQTVWRCVKDLEMKLKETNLEES